MVITCIIYIPKKIKGSNKMDHISLSYIPIIMAVKKCTIHEVQNAFTKSQVFAFKMNKKAFIQYLDSKWCIMWILSTEHVLWLSGHNLFMWLQKIQLATLSYNLNVIRDELESLLH